jgi:hypothetical protein
MTAALACQRRISSSCCILAHWSSLKEHAVFFASSNSPTGCFRPYTNSPNKTNQCSSCGIISQSYRRFYTICRCATATIMDRRSGVYSYILCSYSPNWTLASLCFIATTVPYIGSGVILLQHCRRASNDDIDGPAPAASSPSSSSSSSLTNGVAW